jgi:hypothetical protein
MDGTCGAYGAWEVHTEFSLEFWREEPVWEAGSLTNNLVSYMVYEGVGWTRVAWSYEGGNRQAPWKEEHFLTSSMTVSFSKMTALYSLYISLSIEWPRTQPWYDRRPHDAGVTVAARSKAWTVFVRSNTGIIPLKAWMSVCAFILCLCCPVCR